MAGIASDLMRSGTGISIIEDGAAMRRVCGGSSMTPSLQVGDRVRLASAPSSVRPGDAVLFCSANGDYDIVHRFVFKVPLLPLFVHRGDAIGACVGLAHCDRILGVVPLASRKPSARDMLAGCALVARRAAKKLMRCVQTRSHTPT
jgi:hypothetical protein